MAMAAGVTVDHYGRSALSFLAAHRLDHATARRLDAEWLTERLQHPDTRIVPVWRLRNLVREVREEAGVEVIEDWFDAGDTGLLRDLSAVAPRAAR